MNAPMGTPNVRMVNVSIQRDRILANVTKDLEKIPDIHVEVGRVFFKVIFL